MKSVSYTWTKSGWKRKALKVKRVTREEYEAAVRALGHTPTPARAKRKGGRPSRRADAK